jgi:hypothetical protein
MRREGTRNRIFEHAEMDFWDVSCIIEVDRHRFLGATKVSIYDQIIKTLA